MGGVAGRDYGERKKAREPLLLRSVSGALTERQLDRLR